MLRLGPVSDDSEAGLCLAKRTDRGHARQVPVSLAPVREAQVDDRDVEVPDRGEQLQGAIPVLGLLDLISLPEHLAHP